jgi:hypothetical protein
MITLVRSRNNDYRLMQDGVEVGRAWKFRSQSGFGVSLKGVYWRGGKPNKRSGGSNATFVKRLKDAAPMAEKVLAEFKAQENTDMNSQTRDQIAAIMLQHGTEEQQQEALGYCATGVSPNQELLDTLVKAAIPLEALYLSGPTDLISKEVQQALEDAVMAIRYQVGRNTGKTGTQELTYLNPEIPHLAEEAECVSKCLDDAGVPTHDSEGKELSLWGRVEEYAERRVSGKLEGGVRVHAFNEEGRYEAMQLGEERNLKHNATLILDD